MTMERKLFKTKLCMLYQRGHCPRQTCSFAHGDAELRRFSGSFNAAGRREYKGSDLRDKLERRHSPQRRYSPGRDARGRNAFHGQKQLPYDRGYSPSRSPGKRSERKHRKKQHLDGQSDVSGSLKISDGAEGVKQRPHGANYLLEEQLRQVQLDINMLDDQRSQLEIYMEERIQEVDSLASRNEELEAQLSKEQECCKGITSKIKKFIKAHNRYSRAQEELKRSQARLQKLGDQITSDASRPSANEEDSSVNIVSDGEPNQDNVLIPRNELQNYASPSKKRQRISLGVSEEAKPENSKRSLVGTIRLDKCTRWDGPATQSENNCKEADAVNKIMSGRNGHRSLAMENKNKWRKNGPPSIGSVEKAKGLEAGHMLPSTSMAAHAVDEFVEAIEMEKIEVVGATMNVFHKGAPQESARFPHLPPPPPLPPPPCRDVYKQYEDEDEDVDVEKLDGKTRDADINNEVEVDID